MAGQYAVAILNFMDFCKKQRFTFSEFSLAAVLEYRQIIPALQLLKKVAGRIGTGLTAQVGVVVLSVQSELEAKKPLVCKAEGYDFKVINGLMATGL
jgi:ABC-type transporter Mla maintaining outer membrane lipid asymmetry permease subunit MlaE